MSRYIDADKISTNIVWMKTVNGLFKKEIDEQPTVDVVPVIHAHYEEVSKNNHCGMRCSKCKSRISYKEYYSGNHLYCYKCGAKMDEVVV